MNVRRLTTVAAVVGGGVMLGAVLLAGARPATGQGATGTAPGAAAAAQGVVYRSPTGTTLRLMLDENNLGSEVSLGEITFPPNADSGEHAHDAIEIFYVVSGELEHVVNGTSQILKPGMAGFVRPPDKVRHKTGPAGAKAVVVWSPGIEGRRVASRWQREP